MYLDTLYNHTFINVLMSKYIHKADDEALYGESLQVVMIMTFSFLKLILMFKDGKLQLDLSGQLGPMVIWKSP